MPKNNKIPSTQNYLSINEIRDDAVAMKDGSLRAVILVSSINFSLKSEEEQNAIIQAYVQFLNSLDHSFQIVIQSRRLNIDDYLENLKNIEKDQTNELLKAQTADYRQYISELLELAEIMSKKFYVIVPYNPKEKKGQKGGLLEKFGDLFRPGKAIKRSRQKFEEDKAELFKRVDFVASGLESMGLNAITLDTQSLIELYYNSYNPESFMQEKMPDLRKMNVSDYY